MKKIKRPKRKWTWSDQKPIYQIQDERFGLRSRIMSFEHCNLTSTSNFVTVIHFAFTYDGKNVREEEEEEKKLYSFPHSLVVTHSQATKAIANTWISRTEMNASRKYHNLWAIKMSEENYATWRKQWRFMRFLFGAEANKKVTHSVCTFVCNTLDPRTEIIFTTCVSLSIHCSWNALGICYLTHVGICAV